MIVTFTLVIGTKILWALHFLTLVELFVKFDLIQFSHFWVIVDTLFVSEKTYDLYLWPWTKSTGPDWSKLTMLLVNVLLKFQMLLFFLLFYVHGKHLRSCRDGQLT